MTAAGYLRFPHLHGDLLTFVADDDVWLAPVGGGRAWRLSAEHAEASHPRFSPDGTEIAWVGHQDGAAEVYLASLDGQSSRRLTYWGDQCRVRGWTPDREVLAVTPAGQPFRHYSWAYAIPAAAGGDGLAAARRLPFGPVSDLSVQRSGVFLLNGTFGQEPAFWKRYRGGTAGRLWVSTALAAGSSPAGSSPAGSSPAGSSPAGSSPASSSPAGAPAASSGADGTGGTGPFRRVLAELRSQFASPMLVGGRLVFVADFEGTGNIYSCALDGSDLRRHTDHDGWYARSASTDGQRVVYSCGGELWLLEGLDADGARPIEIVLGSPAAGRAPRLISAADHVGNLSCDRTGQASAVEVRGTVHWLTHRDGPARALAVTTGVRARLPRVLGRDGLVVWVTDAGGEDALEVGGEVSGTPQEPRRVAAGSIGAVAGLAAAPDGSKVAVAARDGRLRLVDMSSGEVSELAAADNGEITGLAWSPDSAWLAWSQPEPKGLESQRLRRLRIARMSDGAVADVTDGRFTDTEPVFTSDGKYLGFLSKRSFDPIYDAHFFDLSFPYGARPFLVPLAAATPSPFGPELGGRPIGGEPGKSEDGGGDAAEPPAVSVDTDGIAGRVVPLPVPESRYVSLRAVKGGLAWLREPVFGNLGEGGPHPADAKPRAALERFDLSKQNVTVLADEADWFEVSGDGSRLVVSDRGSLSVLPAERKADADNPDDRISVDGSRARFLADPAALWGQAYAEAGRLMRHDFWVPDMADVDWDGVLDQYRPLLDRVASPSEFADVLWEVFGELGSSHAYVLKSSAAGHDDGNDGPGSPVGQLGADLGPGDDGAWRVTRVVPGESSDPRARSPLAAPGAQIRGGEQLLAVDGQPVGAAGPGPLLVGAAGRPVELTLAGPSPDISRRIVVVPLGSELRLRYQDWVAGRRARVRELSDGRLGYLHVPDMMSEGWADFHRDLRSEMLHEGLIVDIRGNSGGHTSELVLEKLARRVIAWDVPRGLVPVSYPAEAPRGAVVALADENAGSDGDIITGAIRSLQLGPVVGTRTWGGVIGFVDYLELVEGTRITVPQLSFWFEKYGWGVENYGIDPDVEVVMSPDDWAAGRDPQLDTAVRIALERLAERPAAAPPSTADRPSRRRPPLPPRHIAHVGGSDSAAGCRG